VRGMAGKEEKPTALLSGASGQGKTTQQGKGEKRGKERFSTSRVTEEMQSSTTHWLKGGMKKGRLFSIGAFLGRGAGPSSKGKRGK